ncbi:MAG: hypothetical protein EXQ88_00350 [Alphaproteobacteria bacterium]|nr:hypothetical protein [Alphaproteobacteria bacterium]
MADDQDQSQRTEEPTQKRLDEARGKGDVASSRELSTWFMLAAATGLSLLMAPQISRELSWRLARFLAVPHEMDPAALLGLVTAIGRDFGPILLLPTLVLVVAALISGFVQHGFLLAPERIMPDWSRISPMAGFKRLFSLRACLDLLKGLLKLVLIGALVWAVGATAWRTLEVGPAQPLEVSVDELVLLIIQLLGATTAALTVVAGADYMY